MAKEGQFPHSGSATFGGSVPPRWTPGSVLAHPRIATRAVNTKGKYSLFTRTRYELKNRNFTGFASQGLKGLWLSKTISQDRRLIICESAIDALSYAVLFTDGHARYASIGGKPNPVQPGLLTAAKARMAEGSEIVAAMDADDAGRQLTEVVRRAFEDCARSDLTFKAEAPSGFKDFNDQLRASKAPAMVRMAILGPSPA
jgi:hypothetical protein